MKKHISHKEYQNLLEECADDCQSEYCFLKLFLLEQHPDPRVISQIKLIEKLKYIRSKDAGSDIGMNKTLEIWIGEGYAAAFAKVYDQEEELTIHKLFTKVLEEVSRK
jgi:hypothetical protein